MTAEIPKSGEEQVKGNEALEKEKTPKELNREIDELVEGIRKTDGVSNPDLVKKAELAAEEAKEKIKISGADYGKKKEGVKARFLEMVGVGK